LELQCQTLVSEKPGPGRRRNLPPFTGLNEDSLSFVPLIGREFFVPDGLRLGPGDQITAKAFQLPAIAGIEKGVVFKAVWSEDLHYKSLRNKQY